MADVEGDQTHLLGAGWCASRGIKKGAIIDLAQAAESIKEAVVEVEKHAETSVDSAYVNLGGRYLRGINCSGQSEVRGKNSEVEVDDVERTVTAATSEELPDGHEVLHVLTQSFTVDQQNGILNPIGLSGRDLSVRLHLVSHPSTVARNVVKAVNQAGLFVKGLVCQPLASAEAVLGHDEKQLGAVVIDIGGGNTDVVIYYQGSVLHLEVLPVGGELITRDLALGLRVALKEAEQLKRRAASAFPEAVPIEEMVEIEEIGTRHSRTVSRRFLCQIVRARCDEILQDAARAIDISGVRAELLTGAVLTGGGCLLDGLAERAEQILKMPVRLGYPRDTVSGSTAASHPGFSTALGLCLYAGAWKKDDVMMSGSDVERRGAPRESTKGKRMMNWILEKIS